MTQLSKASQKPITSMVVLSLSLMIVGMGQTVVFAIIPMLGREMGFGEIAINSLISGAALMYFLSAPRWGRLSDRFGRKPMIVIGLVGCAVGTLLFNVAAWAGLVGILSGAVLYGLLLLSRMVLASIMCAVQPSAMAFVADTTTVEQRTAGLSKMTAANGIGSMVGPGLTVFAAFSLLTPLYIYAFMALAMAVIVLKWLPESRDIHERRREKKLSYFDPRIRGYIFLGVILYMMMAVFQQTLGYYFQDVLHLNASQTTQKYGQGMIVSSAVMLFTQLVLVQRFNWSPAFLLKLGIPILLCAFIITALASSFTVLLCAMALFGLGIGLAGPGYAAGASLKVSRQEQGAVAGLISAAPGLGFVVGPLIGGAVYQISPQAPYIMAALVFIPLGIYLWKKA